MMKSNPERANFWRIPEYGDMELLHAKYITHRFPLHFHEEYVVGVIERGYYEFYFEGDRQQIREGEIVMINPGEIHSGYALDNAGWQYRTFYPGVTLMRQIATEITGEDWHFPTFKSPVLANKIIAQRLIALHRAMESSPTRLVKDVFLREAMGLLIGEHATNTREHLRVQYSHHAIVIVQDYIQSHYADDIALDDLAKVAGLSPYHLARVFKAQVGLAPHQYLIQVRIQRAKGLLASGMSISDVAYAVGFADQSHLSKWFKRVMGVPPGQFVG